ncbi:Protein kinase C-like 1 [Entomortierella chlamydospora]|uniref:Protein kinase C-like 1 n=1 Tax=Entomortierella chlamydospora TaxID=101097 RepID=A0A9P6MCU2_9FUNG|nr:Protein kinase C-like 1 [Entomortierella chlamydospora]
MLAQKIEEHKADVWLINTGWTGGAYGKTGQRISLKYSRGIIDAIHSGELKKAQYQTYPIFDLQIPTEIPGIPSDKLAQLFKENFTKYQDQATPEIIAAGPKI